MADTKRVKLEKNLEALTSRHQAKNVQLQQLRGDLAAINEKLSIEADGSKWESLANSHGLAEVKISALVDEIAVLAGKVRAARLDLNDYDLAVVQAEISQLVMENQGIRVKADTLRNEFRVLCSRPSADIEIKQKVLDTKTEISQLELAGGLTTKQIESAKRRRAELMQERESIG